MTQASVQQRTIQGARGGLSVRIQGKTDGPSVVMTHSILSSGAMWEAQAALLGEVGYQVVRIDTTGHGDSEAPSAALDMDGLGADVLAVLDALGLSKAHYVGLSLGGMSGFGLAIRHASRFDSFVLCAARADAPPAVAAPWDERISIAQQAGSCSPLAAPTVERWFGREFVSTQRATAAQFEAIAARTTVTGFVSCARAIQGLNYLDQVGDIRTPTTLVVGTNDGVLPDAMRDLNSRIAGSILEIIPNAGHLPNVDQPQAFNAALLRHFERLAH